MTEQQFLLSTALHYILTATPHGTYVPCWYTLSGPTQHTMLIKFFLELVTVVVWKRDERKGEDRIGEWNSRVSGEIHT